MAIQSANDWFAAAKQRVNITKSFPTSTGYQGVSSWTGSGQPGAGTGSAGNTSSGVLFTAATSGAPAINSFGGGATGYLSSAVFRATAAGCLSILDRIWGAGAVSAASLATTTLSSQPSISGRVPGGTAYQEVEAFLEVVTAIPAAAVTVTLTYTNEAGVTGHTSSAESPTGLAAGRIIKFSLQAGDLGIQTVESIVVGGVAAASGDFNVILARRLADMDIRGGGCEVQGWDLLGSEVYDTSCLWLIAYPDSTTIGITSVSMTIVNH